MKTAASLDGKTALHSGDSQWITSQQARDDGHAWRARACAILTGIGTVLQDNPQLNVRAVATPRQPRRIVIDSRLAIAPEASILVGGGSWVFTAVDAPAKRQLLEAGGTEVIVLANRHGKVDLPAVVAELGKRQINELHVEAGAKLNASLISEGCVDELLVYLAPAIIGDARDMFALPALAGLHEQIALKFHDVQRIGPDLRLLARF
jgi:diaminohydroxyphosphoribosylaminopyrimidine deaminase/5-amino-6-(5-phosphoribosylamino)uracil reductase